MAGRARRRAIVLFGVIFLLAVSLIFITSRERAQTSWVERLVQDALTPVQRVVSGISYYLADSWKTLRQLSFLRQENAYLHQRLTELAAENVLLRQYQRENEELRRLLGFRQTVSYQLTAAQVVSRDPSNWFNTLTIDKGRADGLKPHQPVITDEGVVGQIRHVNQHSADVLMILDSKSAVGGQIQNTQDFVLVEGAADGSGKALVKPLSPEVEIKEGDIIVTSGLGGVFPKGLLLGKVIQVKQWKYGLTKIGILEPAVRFSRLEKVFVITSVTAQ